MITELIAIRTDTTTGLEQVYVDIVIRPVKHTDELI